MARSSEYQSHFLLENGNWLLGSWIFQEVQKIQKAVDVFNEVLSCDKSFLRMVQEGQKVLEQHPLSEPRLSGERKTGVRSQNSWLVKSAAEAA